MLPKFLIIAFIFGVKKISAQQDIIKNVNNSVIENPLTFRYDYTITGKNNSYEQRSEYGNEKESKGNYFIQLPDGESKYEVHYTANNWGFHPVVRYSTKNNHSEVTSHFTQNENIIKSLNKNNQNKSDEIYNDNNTPNRQYYIQYDQSPSEEQNRDDKDTTISLNNIISNMFSKGIVNFLSTKSITAPINSDNNNDEIPSESLDDVTVKSNNAINSTKNLLNDLSNIKTLQNISTTKDKTFIFDNINNFENTTSSNLNIFVTDFESSQLPLINSPLPTASINIPINNSLLVQEKQRINENQIKSKENFVSDEDVLGINDAAEEYRNFNNDNKDISPNAEESLTPVINKLKLFKDRIFSLVYPQNNTDSFDLPIIVDDNSNNVNEDNNEDNLIAEESQKSHSGNYLIRQPPTEIKIIPSRAQFINIPRTKSEKQVNVKIVQEIMKQLPGKIINGKKLFTPSYELDSYHENAENNFSIEDNKYTTEAQSRKFLKHFNSKLSPSGIIKERIYPTTKLPTTVNPIKSTFRYSVTPPTLTKINRNLKSTTSISKNITPTKNSLNSKIIVNFETTTPIPLKKNHGKTFVEIQKSINVHNLLIKEDKNGKFIEQHEEYLKPYQKILFKEFKHLQNNEQTNQYLPTKNPNINNNYHQSTVVPPKTLTIPFPENNQYFDINQKTSTEKNVENILSLSYPVEKFIENPVPKVVESVEKSVPVPYQVDKFIDRPIHVTKYIDKPYNVETVSVVPVKQIIEKPIDRPYPVDKPYPVTVEKIIEKEVPVINVFEKYIDRPVPYPVEQYIPQPYPVEQIVEKIIDRPVEVEKIVEKTIPVTVEVEKIVEKFIDRNVTVEKIVDRPIEVEKIVEKIIDRPVPIAYPVHIPIHIPYHIPLPASVPSTNINYNRNNHFLHQNKLKSNINFFTDIQFPHLGSNSESTIDFSRELFTLVHPTPPHINAINFFNQPAQQHLSTLHTQSINRPFYKFPSRYITDHQISPTSISLQSVTAPLPSESQHIPIKYAKNFSDKTIYPGQYNDYFGPVPLENDYSQWQKYYSSLDGVSTLHKRSSDFGRNLRVEYGFKPPLIPSIETDEQGVPIEKND